MSKRKKGYYAREYNGWYHKVTNSKGAFVCGCRSLSMARRIARALNMENTK